MKFRMEAAERIFCRAFREQQARTWLALSQLVTPRLAPMRPLERRRVDLELALDEDEEVAEADAPARAQQLSERLVLVANMIATAPFRQLAQACVRSECDEVTVPAGCDPLDPAEILSAVHRATDHVSGWTDAFLLVPEGAEGFFADAFRGPGPAECGGRLVHILGSDQLIEPAALEQALRSKGETVADPVQAQQSAALDLLRSTPWYVLLAGQPEFSYYFADDPRLAGPQLAIEYAAELAGPKRPERLVRVTASRLALASVVPPVKVAA